MNAKEHKALLLAAVPVIMLGQPAFARGGGFGGGFGAGFASTSHGFGGFGIHGFNAGYSASSHVDRADISNQRAKDSDCTQPEGGEQPKQNNSKTSPQVVANTMPKDTALTVTEK